METVQHEPLPFLVAIFWSACSKMVLVIDQSKIFLHWPCCGCGSRAGCGPLTAGLEGGSGNSAARGTTILSCNFRVVGSKMVLVIDKTKTFCIGPCCGCGIRAECGPLAGGLKGPEVETVQHESQPCCIFFGTFCSKVVLDIDQIKFFGIGGDNRGCGSSLGSGAVSGKQSDNPRRNRTGHALTNLGFRGFCSIFRRWALSRAFELS